MPFTYFSIELAGLCLPGVGERPLEMEVIDPFHVQVSPVFVDSMRVFMGCSFPLPAMPHTVHTAGAQWVKRCWESAE